MHERYLLVSGKTLIELTENLNDPDLGLGKVVYVEKTRGKYTALIDLYATVIIHIDEVRERNGIDDGEELEFTPATIKTAITA